MEDNCGVNRKSIDLKNKGSMLELTEMGKLKKTFAYFVAFSSIFFTFSNILGYSETVYDIFSDFHSFSFIFSVVFVIL